MRLLIPTPGSATESAPVRGEPAFDEAAIPADFAFSRLRGFNQQLASYGLPDWDSSLDPDAHGPPLGQGLGCTTCHDGRTRGVLTVHTSEGLLRQKVVDQLSMRSPLGGKSVPNQEAMALLERETTGSPALSSEEQIQLAQARAEHSEDHTALVADRFRAWQAWVLETRCENQVR
jgi:hypothetical protein